MRDEKWQYDINRESAKIWKLWSGKIDKYKFITGKEILPSDQSRIIKQANLIYCPLGTINWITRTKTKNKKQKNEEQGQK